MVNLEYLRDLADGSIEFMIEMIEMFIELSPTSVADIDRAMKEKDYERLKAYAHKMKSSASIVGANDLLEDLKLLEKRAGLLEDVESLPDLVAQVLRKTSEVVEILKIEKEKL